MDKPFKFLHDLEQVLTNYNEGQKENSQNNNLVVPGIPRSGKGQVTGWAKEHGLAGDHIKLFEVHASKISHLAEVFQFLFPNGFFLNRKAKKELDSVDEPKGVKQLLEQGRYSDPDTTVEEIEEVINVFENRKPPERIEKLDELIEEESNRRLRERLQEAREKQVEVRDRLQQIHRWCYTNPDVPDLFRKNYADGLNDSFSIQVFTPISRDMPTCDVPDFFEPFAVPVDDFKEYEQLKWGLRIVHTDRFNRYKEFYNRAVQIGETSYQDLRNVDELNESDNYVSREYGDGQEFRDTRVSHQKDVKAKFERDWDGQFPEGVVCSGDFEYKLRPRLKEAMLSDEPDIVTLYTGFISDEALRKFVMVYFMETMFDIVRNLSGSELRKLDCQFIASILEAQEVIKKSSKTNSLSAADRAFNRFIWEAMNDSGHYNFNFWFDTKPSETHRNLLSKASTRIVTRMNKEDVRSWYNGSKRDKILRAFSTEDYRKLDGRYPEFGYGFLYDDEVVEWQENGRTRFGHRLPCPRMCVQDPVDEISNDDWSLFTEELDRWGTMNFQEYMDALFKQDWEKSAEPYIEEAQRRQREKEKKREEEEQTRKEMLQEMAREKLKLKIQERGEIPDSWTSLCEEILEDLHQDGHAEEWEHHRNVMDATKELRHELEEEFQAGVDDFDPEEISREVRRDQEWIEKLLFGATSKPEKKYQMKKFIQEKYEDVSGNVAEELAEDSAREVSMWLKMQNYMTNGHQPEVKKEEFRQEMGFNVSSEDVEEVQSDPDDEETVEVEEQDESEAEDLGELPGEEWSCQCGALNGPDRAVCRKCAGNHEETRVD
ncbi:hypothetical protein ACM16X_02740 [Haloarcula japonica]|uniref:hypothetical protein n=1 Tax=Haloarcula japonica TaxID=29282 RepID=UPI0039F6BF2A